MDFCPGKKTWGGNPLWPKWGGTQGCALGCQFVIQNGKCFRSIGKMETSQQHYMQPLFNAVIINKIALPQNKIQMFVLKKKQERKRRKRSCKECWNLFIFSFDKNECTCLFGHVMSHTHRILCEIWWGKYIHSWEKVIDTLPIKVAIDQLFRIFWEKCNLSRGKDWKDTNLSFRKKFHRNIPGRHFRKWEKWGNGARLPGFLGVFFRCL